MAREHRSKNAEKAVVAREHRSKNAVRTIPAGTWPLYTFEKYTYTYTENREFDFLNIGPIGLSKFWLQEYYFYDQ